MAKAGGAGRRRRPRATAGAASGAAAANDRFADGDYGATSGILYFFAGQTTATIGVTIYGDRKKEPNETFFVNLSNAVNADIADAQGIGTILNDDGGRGKPFAGGVSATDTDALVTAPLITEPLQPVTVAATGPVATSSQPPVRVSQVSAATPNTPIATGHATATKVLDRIFADLDGGVLTDGLAAGLHALLRR